MNLISAAVLGIIQGLTEFLPVSSSGHLVLAQALIPGFTQQGILFDVFLHAGTLFAVFFYFRKRLVEITWPFLTLIVIGTIPAALVGYLFQDTIEILFDSTKLVGIALFVTALLNFYTDTVKTRKKKISKKNAIIIGLAQAIAITPGISRSGLTIFAGVIQKIKREKAAEFSFLLSVPAVLGANILQFVTHGEAQVDNPTYYVVGFLFSFLVGMLAIGWVMKFLLSKSFKIFGIYCLVLGVIALLL